MKRLLEMAFILQIFYNLRIAELVMGRAMIPMRPMMAPRDQSDAAAEGKVAKMTAKKSSAEKSSSGNPSYKDMVIEAITVQKEKSGSSLDGIKKFLGSTYHIDVAKQAGRLNRCLR